MENLYDILQSEPGASTEELRKAYNRLVRLFHPDKVSSQHVSVVDDEKGDKMGYHVKTATETFVKIDRAWKVLRDPQTRAQFDAKWHERCLVQSLPIQETVHVSDFTFDEEHYTYPCRCGSDYVISELDIQLQFDIVCCETCSLTIKVLYDGNI